MISKDKILPPIYVNLDKWAILDADITYSLAKIELVYIILNTIKKIGQIFPNDP